TSFSSPIAAGVAALVVGKVPAIAAARLQDVLVKSTIDLGADGFDAVFGWGAVDAAASIAASTNQPIRIRPGAVVPSVFAGTYWSADRDYNLGSTGTIPGWIGGTSQPENYQAYRAGDFWYTFTLPNGSYEVRMGFV